MAVLVLREADDITTVLRQALDTAPAEERPGLERAMALTAEAGAVPDAELRGRWALRRMASAGYEGPPRAVAAVKALRTAERSLSLLQAVNLSKDAEAVALDGQNTQGGQDAQDAQGTQDGRPAEPDAS